MAGKIIDLDKGNFDSTIGGVLPVLVDFWAPWCGPCRAIAPTLEEIAGEMDGKVVIAKVNVDEAGEIAGRFGVRSIPTLLLFKGGQVREQIVGAVAKSTIVAAIQKNS